MIHTIYTRRQFLKVSTVGAAAAYLTPVTGSSPAYAALPASLVITSIHRGLVDANERINFRTVRTVVDETLLALTNTRSIQDAWAAIFPKLQSSDVIGIKVNCINRRHSSHPEVVYAIAESLSASLHFNPNNLLIWDRTSSELMRAGYEMNTGKSGIRCLATSDGIGYDRHAPVEVGHGKTVHLSKILSQMCTYLINVPVLKDHGTAGLTLSLKNHYGSIDRPGSCHGGGCDPYIANLNAAPLIREKTALIVCDAIFGIYQGGPMGAPQWIAHQILAGTDPVALDTVGMGLIDVKRQEKGIASVSQRISYLHTASRLGIGTNNPDQITTIEQKLG
ncbi:hypothetical protein U27_03039 [Candidatus Vecturithrix granuli]|uniref:DUF362 domain-containing protein n=1 Tax=Vecturithrix granuli TaxID=1499967 RepID=A0A081BUS2_VECG1|nr:hypothetical protein U27_03039 [Candidatus Vecturithrix granuli]